MVRGKPGPAVVWAGFFSACRTAWSATNGMVVGRVAWSAWSATSGMVGRQEDIGMVENLTEFELRQVARLLLHKMGMETRRQLMATQPVSYVKLFPHVSEDVVLGKVQEWTRDARS